MSPDDLEFAERVLRRLQALSERGMRARVVRETLLDADPASCIALLGRIVERCIFGVAPGEDAMLALIPCLLDMHGARGTLVAQRRKLAELADGGQGVGRRVLDPEGHLELWDRLRELYDRALALRDDDDAVVSLLADAACRLLAEPPPFKQPPARHERFGPRWDRQITLGERKAMASGGNRAVLERLIYDRDPLVVRKLCLNPRLLEQDILLIATRRPNDPEVLHEIARSEWLSRYRVRHALVLNPYNATGLSIRLLPLLHAHHVNSLRFAGDVHPQLVNWAVDVAAWRDRGPTDRIDGSGTGAA